MKEDEFVKRLLAASPPPPPDHAARQRTIQLLHTLPPRRRVGAGRFLLGQIGFIHKRMWALQLAFLVGIYLLVRMDLPAGEAAVQLYWRLSAAMPLLILINITDLVRIYNGGMVEIELATRFSLPRVAAARLLIFGLTDGVLLLAAAAMAASTARASLLLVLLYCLVPFDLMCLGCLWLLPCVKPGHFAPLAAVLAVTLAAIPAVGNTWLYQRVTPPVWGAAALALTLALAWQSARLLRGMRPGRAGLRLL